MKALPTAVHGGLPTGADDPVCCLAQQDQETIVGPTKYTKDTKTTTPV